MDFRIAHRFNCSAADWWRASKQPEFEAAVAAASNVTITKLSEERSGHVTRARLRVVPAKDLPPIVQKAVGAPRFSYVQELEETDDSFEQRWKVLPDVLADKINVSGTLRVTDVPGGCERVIAGRIEVRVMLVGGTIEKGVVEELQAGYDRSAADIGKILPGLLGGNA
jgi:hypothetical protein